MVLEFLTVLVQYSKKLRIHTFTIGSRNIATITIELLKNIIYNDVKLSNCKHKFTNSNKSVNSSTLKKPPGETSR